ncbi:Uncharacterised protein [Mycobacterium tuberculosis]|uniref:Uncharacterized protein n=1 Tax=Mycobacterium tuberculosis TaxID=1773 RepID=A0A654U825_MYCTX|nr:Uncharacterised protein [Mycobacterium tuberculosis]CFS33832.1 Uncharacterised protein [Mycobacterium tuberculosis]COW83716.1 Uncharacterised protein [Mycobacterium tuberculosis]COX24554.1 Uncharacterised protein [Mycobacterium tuberculosis]COZ63116.1 Uncharacterised protein [Mycobacterium tuberculosis]
MICCRHTLSASPPTVSSADQLLGRLSVAGPDSGGQVESRRSRALVRVWACLVASRVR